MANIKSQIKRNRQNELRRDRNRGVRSRLRTITKRYLQATDSNDSEAAQNAYRDVSSSLDKAAAKGIIHKNKAANQKARLAKHLPS